MACISPAHAVGGVDANHLTGIVDAEQNRAAGGVRERNDFTVQPGQRLPESEALSFPFGQEEGEACRGDHCSQCTEADP